MKGTMIAVVALLVTVVTLFIKNHKLNSEIERSIIARDITKKTMQENLQEEANRYLALKQDMTRADQEIKDLTSKLKTAQNDLSNAVNSLQEATDNVKKLESESAAKTEAMGPLKEEIQQLRGDVEQKTQALQEAEARLNTQQQQLSNLSEVLQATRKELQHTKADAEENLVSIKGFQKKHDEFADEINRLAKFKAFNEQLTAENKDLQKKLENSLTNKPPQAETNPKPIDVQEEEQYAAPLTQIESKNSETEQLAAPQQEESQAVTEGGAGNATGVVSEAEATTETVDGGATVAQGGDTADAVNEVETTSEVGDGVPTVAPVGDATVEVSKAETRVEGGKTEADEEEIQTSSQNVSSVQPSFHNESKTSQ